MSKFYGTVVGASQTSASRRGNHDIRVSAQSWDGSVITRLWYNDNEVLNVDVEIASGSSVYGQIIFSGTFEEFCRKPSG